MQNENNIISTDNKKSQKIEMDEMMDELFQGLFYGKPGKSEPGKRSYPHPEIPLFLRKMAI